MLQAFYSIQIVIFASLNQLRIFMKAYFSINSCPANFGFKQPRYVDICHIIYV